MPFTPFHMGAGMLIKSTAPKKFTLILFGWSQITMDLQPLYVMITGRGELHGGSHTFLGASLIALVTAFLFREISYQMARYSAKWWHSQQLPNPFREGMRRISWRMALITALIGTYSHILLDMLMHYDCQPFRPFSSINPLAGHISLEGQYLFSLLLGVVGLLIYIVRAFIKRSTLLNE